MPGTVRRTLRRSHGGGQEGDARHGREREQGLRIGTERVELLTAHDPEEGA